MFQMNNSGDRHRCQETRPLPCLIVTFCRSFAGLTFSRTKKSSISPATSIKERFGVLGPPGHSNWYQGQDLTNNAIIVNQFSLTLQAKVCCTHEQSKSTALTVGL